jgi:hypothetical protein
MKKAIFVSIIAVMLVAALAGFAPAKQDDFVIGIMTGTVSQGEEEFRAAQNAAQSTRQNHYRNVPDNFSTKLKRLLLEPWNWLPMAQI